MHVKQKSNVLNIKRKTWGSVGEEGAAALDATRGRFSPDDGEGREPAKQQTEHTGDLTARGGRASCRAAPALSLTVTVMVTRPRPKPFPLVANLLNTRELPSPAQAPRSCPRGPARPAAASPRRGA